MRIKRHIQYLVSASILASPSAQAAPPDVNFTVTMSEAVNVNTGSGTPRIAVNVDGQTRYATYSAGTGTSSLTFSYAPTIGDLDLDGVALTSPLDLNGGVITDLNGNPETDLTFTIPNTSGVKVDYPSLSMDFTNGASGRYTLNGTAYTGLSSFLTATSGSFTRSSTATYFDSTGTLQTASNNTPRFDYDPATLTAKGLLMEEARTNYIYNSEFSGLSGGTYSAVFQASNHWELAMPAPLTAPSVIMTPGTTNGINYLDMRVQASNTSGSTQYITFTMPIADQLAVTNGTATIAKAWLGVSAYSSIGGTCTVDFQVRSMTSGNSYITSRDVTVSSTTPFQERSTASLVHGATAAKSSWLSYVSIPNGATCDITYRIGAPQLEVGKYTTSYIPTTSAPATRNVETLTIPTASWYNQSSGTFFNDVSWVTFNIGLYPMFFRVDDGTSNNRWNAFYNHGLLRLAVDALTSSVNQGSWGVSYPVSGSGKISCAQQLNDSNCAFNNALQTQTTSWSPPPVTQLRLYNSASAAGASKWFKTIKYYPQRSSDT